MIELEGYITQMRTLKSKVMGGFLVGDVILPYRLSEAVPKDQALNFRKVDTPEFVLCHILIYETTLKINAILH